MNVAVGGTPSDQLPEVLATGRSDIVKAFISMSKREPRGRDADYLAWHALDHRPEQHRLAGLRQSLRIVSTPACRAARAASHGRYDDIDHVMTYWFSADGDVDGFAALSAALGGARRPFRLPSVESGYFAVAGRCAAPAAVAGADVLPWRAMLGVYLLVENGAIEPAALCEVPGVAGVWWHRGGPQPAALMPDSSGRLVSHLFLDDEPLAVAERLRPALAARWRAGEVEPLLAAPFFVPVPFEWDRYLP